MKRIFLMTVAILLLQVEVVAQSRCTKCGGSGRMTIFHSMATYGISRSKQQCPICRQWFFRGTEHKETCDRCNGTGKVTTALDRQNSSRNSRTNDAADEALSYLTPAELTQYYNLVEQMKGHTETVPCRLCQGRGLCISCRGIGYIGEFPCPTCGGLGRCSSCGGQRIEAYTRLVEPTPAEKERIQRQIAELIKNAMSRR